MLVVVLLLAAEGGCERCIKMDMTGRGYLSEQYKTKLLGTTICFSQVVLDGRKHKRAKTRDIFDVRRTNIVGNSRPLLYRRPTRRRRLCAAQYTCWRHENEFVLTEVQRAWTAEHGPTGPF